MIDEGRLRKLSQYETMKKQDDDRFSWTVIIKIVIGVVLMAGLSYITARAWLGR